MPIETTTNRFTLKAILCSAPQLTKSNVSPLNLEIVTRALVSDGINQSVLVFTDQKRH